MVDGLSTDEHTAEVIDLFGWRKKEAEDRSKARHPSQIIDPSEDDSASR